MNSAKSFIATLSGLIITLKPADKLKDRPVQTMTFGEITEGQYGPEVETTSTFINAKGSCIQLTRKVSAARALEYVVEASTQQHDPITYVAPEPKAKAVKAEAPAEVAAPAEGEVAEVVAPAKKGRKAKAVEVVAEAPAEDEEPMAEVAEN